MSDAPTYPDFVRALFAKAETMRPNLEQEHPDWPEEAGAALSLAVDGAAALDELKRILAYGKAYDCQAFGVHNRSFMALEGDFLGADFRPLEDWELEFAHAAIGLFTEAGELMEQLHARVCKGEPMDVENLNEETGDSGFYLQAAINVLVDQLGQRHPQEGNVEKLMKRYPGGEFTPGDALARADKQDGEGKKVSVLIEELDDGTISCTVEGDRQFPLSGDEASFPEKIGVACMRFVGESLRGSAQKEEPKPGLILMPGGGQIKH